MMKNRKIKSHSLNKKTLQLVGILLIFLAAILLLWHGNVNSNQATGAIAAKVYFEGEYRIGDGQWRKIVKGEHISSTNGDVTLRGNFHSFSPDGEYVGIFQDDIPIAFCTDHINLTIYEEGKEPYIIDYENPVFGDSACGVGWTAHTFSGGTEPIEMVVHNPHSFGNETAIDELLSDVAIWGNIDFEKEILDSGEPQRNTGLLFVIGSLVFLGTALFSTLIHIKSSRIIWLSGWVVLFAGTYFMYSAKGVSFWRESIVSNTTILGSSIIFYMLFLSMAILYFLESTKKAGAIAVTILGTVDTMFFVLPVVTDIFFYDTWGYWVIIQIVVNIILLVCLLKEFVSTKGKKRWIYIGALLPLISFVVDAVMTTVGRWKGGLISKCVFVILFVAVMIMVLRVIPRSINIATKAKELEVEKTLLNDQLAESRISTMMSQIRPHFIYNTLGSIEQLCELDPPKAGQLVHNFAKYLRGNFGELDNPKPIHISKEMEHVQHYIKIENVRFPDMTFSFEMNSVDFKIPALTIQPIVENAIKHGLMKLKKGGTIRVISYETDSHYCVTVEDDGIGFDTSILLDEREHVGIRNIRGRLKAMVDGTLDIQSTVGVGTEVLISIPKEVQK